MFHECAISSEIKKETIRFSSETAHIKKRDGVLRLSGDVQIEFGKFIIKSDFLNLLIKSYIGLPITLYVFPEDRKEKFLN